MDANEWVRIIVSILAGLATAIPLVVELVKYVKEAIKERNWTKLVDLVMEYMERAEEMFDNGSDRKEWVLAMVEASTDTLNFDIDLELVGQLIDSLCAMSKVVNPPANRDDMDETV